MIQRFAGKVVLVIGGNSGIGLASAKAFADEGAQVLISGRDPDTLRTAALEIGRGAAAHCADISDLRQITSLFSCVRETVRRVDVLFVNAGVAVLLPIESVTEADWDRLQGINLKGAFFTVQAALPFMPKGSVILLTGSVAGIKGGSGGSVYAASKAGLRALGRSLAAEFVDRGIRVNVISPGPVETPMFCRTAGVRAEEVPGWRREMIESTPMKRMGTPEEVAAAVLFLASSSAAFVTGIDFLVDGGAGSL